MPSRRITTSFPMYHACRPAGRLPTSISPSLLACGPAGMHPSVGPRPSARPLQSNAPCRAETATTATHRLLSQPHIPQSPSSACPPHRNKEWPPTTVTHRLLSHWLPPACPTATTVTHRLLSHWLPPACPTATTVTHWLLSHRLPPACPTATTATHRLLSQVVLYRRLSRSILDSGLALAAAGGRYTV